MARNYTRRSDDEWLDLITTSRKSGLADADWCRQNNIAISSFYNAVTRLRKKACDLPEPSDAECIPTMDLTNRSQDIVPILLEDDTDQASSAVIPYSPNTEHLDNSYMIEIVLGQTRIRIQNGTDPQLLNAVLAAVR